MHITNTRITSLVFFSFMVITVIQAEPTPALPLGVSLDFSCSGLSGLATSPEGVEAGFQCVFSFLPLKPALGTGLIWQPSRNAFQFPFWIRVGLTEKVFILGGLRLGPDEKSNSTGMNWMIRFETIFLEAKSGELNFSLQGIVGWHSGAQGSIQEAGGGNPLPASLILRSLETGIKAEIGLRI